MSINPNPQGKGLVPLLGALSEATSRAELSPKSARQISVELFTSLFVLQSRFQFKPVIGRSYWLYWKNNEFRLSLISPSEGGESFLGLAVGESVLQPDITWSLDLTDAARADAELMAYIHQQRESFEKGLAQAKSIDQALPYYRERLPFYQRVFAAGLSQSLLQSARNKGIAGLNYEAALKLLS